DAVLVILTPQAMTDPTGAAKAIGEVAANARKPVLAVWMGGRMVREGVQLLNNLGVPTYSTPWHAVRAFMYLVSYSRNLELLYETPRDLPQGLALDRVTARHRFETAVNEMAPRVLPAEEPLILAEDDSKELLEFYGIPTTRPAPAISAAAAVEAARRIGFPVVLKIASPDITHKTDVGGVALNLADEAAVSAAFDEIVASARAKRPEARIEGVSVQRMVAVPDAFELILGSKQDPVFGAVILVGMGGVTAELFQDRALGLPPLNERLARRMLESLRSWPLLTGYRGRPAAQLDTLVETVVRFSYLVADFPEITELDINPLLAMHDGVLALDARVVVDRQRVLHPVRAFAHLAIRPYPEEYVRSIELADGTRVLLRPIKPEDEPLWHELLAACSVESRWSRFRYLFKETTHDMASHFCFIDYDRELAIVAELEEDGRRKLAGVVRLVADPDHDEAEYAVLVGDPWQRRGLGSRLTDYALEIARVWQVRRLTAETAPDNSRMLAMFKHRGFELDYKIAPDVVIARKVLDG
ncbi:MAG TPA: GNAT family N-acetyltransferase, partial [Pirellulales bacterium]|nr:GNAT family N-acetyltransferase [Pirellulales bacterium]